MPTSLCLLVAQQQEGQEKADEKLVLYRQASGLGRWPVPDPNGLYIGGRVARTTRHGMGRRMKNKFLSAFSPYGAPSAPGACTVGGENRRGGVATAA